MQLVAECGGPVQLVEGQDPREIQSTRQMDSPAIPAETIPLSLITKHRCTAAIYFELEPGGRVPSHSDGTDEVLLILDGMVEVTIGKMKFEAGGGAAVVVPAAEPVALFNAGPKKARLVRFFPRDTLVSTFQD